MKLRLSGINIERIYKTGGTALLFVLVVWGAIFLGGKVLDARTEIAQLKVDVANLERNQDEYLRLKNALQGSLKRGSQLSQLVPARNDILNNIQLLEQVANQTGNTQSIQIVEVAPGTKGVKAPKKSAIEPTLTEKFNSVNYVISVEGGFTSFMQYLKSLENQPFLTTIKSVSSTAKTESAGNNNTFNTGVLITKIEGVFYYLK